MDTVHECCKHLHQIRRYVICLKDESKLKETYPKVSPTCASRESGIDSSNLYRSGTTLKYANVTKECDKLLTTGDRSRHVNT